MPNEDAQASHLGEGLQKLMSDLQALVDEERERAADEVREAVEAAIHNGNGHDEQPAQQSRGESAWLTRSEAAREFDVSMTHLMTLEKNGELKSRRKGRNVLLSRAQLKKALRDVRAA